MAQFARPVLKALAYSMGGVVFFVHPEFSKGMGILMGVLLGLLWRGK